MEIKVETLLNENSMKLVNKLISYTNTLSTINEVVKKLRHTIYSLDLQNEFICGTGSNHIWLSRKEDGERILLITE